MINAANVQHGLLLFGQVERKLAAGKLDTVATILDSGAAIWSGEGWSAMETALRSDIARLSSGAPSATALKTIRAHAKQSLDELGRLQEGRTGSFPKPAGTAAADDAARGAATTHPGSGSGSTRSTSRADAPSSSSGTGTRPRASSSDHTIATRLADELGVTVEWADDFVESTRRQGWHGAPDQLAALHLQHGIPLDDAFRAVVRMHERGFGSGFLRDVTRLAEVGPNQQEWVLSFATNAAALGWRGAADDVVRAYEAGLSLLGAHKLTMARYQQGLYPSVIDDAITLHVHTRGGEAWAIDFAVEAAQRGWRGAADAIVDFEEQSGLGVRTAWEAVRTQRAEGFGAAYLDDVRVLAGNLGATGSSAISVAKEAHARGWRAAISQVAELAEDGVPVREGWQVVAAAYEHGQPGRVISQVRTLVDAGFSGEYAARAAQFFTESGISSGSTSAARLADAGLTPDFAVKVVAWADRTPAGLATMVARMERHLAAGHTADDAVTLAAAGR